LSNKDKYYANEYSIQQTSLKQIEDKLRKAKKNEEEVKKKEILIDPEVYDSLEK